MEATTKEVKRILEIEGVEYSFMFNFQKVKVLEAHKVNVMNVLVDVEQQKLPSLETLNIIFNVGIQNVTNATEKAELFKKATESGYITLMSFLMELIAEDLGFMFR